MEKEILSRLEEQGKKIDAIFASVEKSRRYFLIALWITIGAVLLPLVGLIFALPAFLESYTTSLDGLL